MEADIDLYPLRVVREKSGEEIIYYTKDKKINNYLQELCNNFQTKRKNLLKYIKFIFNHEEFKNYYYEVTFNELFKKNIQVIVILKKFLDRKNEIKKPIMKKNNFCINKNLTNYLFDFLSFYDIEPLYSVNKKFYNVINFRRQRYFFILIIV